MPPTDFPRPAAAGAAHPTRLALDGAVEASRRVALLVAALVGLAGLALTAAVVLLSHGRARLHADALFERQADLYVAQIERVLQRPVDWLQGLTAAAPPAGAGIEHWLADSLGAEDHQPGRHGVALLGWATWQGSPGDGPLVVAATAGGTAGAGFEIGTVADTPALRDALVRARQAMRPELLPLDAWGLDRAPDSPVDHLVIAPVSRPGAGAGVLFAAVSVARLVAPVRDRAGEHTAVRLDELQDDGRWRPLAGMASPDEPDAGAESPGGDGSVLRRSSRVVEAGGRELMLSVTGRPSSDEIDARDRVRAYGLAGLLLTLLASVAAGRLAAGRERAQHLARSLTADVERLAEVVRHTGSAIAITDGRRRIEWVNEGFTRMFGFTAEQAAGRTPQGLLALAVEQGGDAGLLERIWDDDRMAPGGGRPELLARARDGRLVWVELEIQLRRDRGGHAVGCVFVANDVSARKEAERALQGALADAGRLAEELGVMAGAVRHAANGVVITDAEGRVTWVNPGFERITGWTLAELLGQTPGSMLQCERTDRQEVARLREALRRRERFSGELLNRSKDHRDYWVAIDIQPVVGWDGSHAGFMAIETDVTERRELLDDLRDSVALVESVFEALPLPVAMKDAEGRVQRLNQAAVEWLGQPREAVLGRTAAELFPADFARRHEAEERELLQRPGHLRYELSVRAGDGRRTDQLVSKRTVLDAAGRAIGTVVALVDVTAQRDAARVSQEAREAAEAANRAKSVFLATMSHEIRTPMNGVIGMAELLAADPALPPAQAEQVATIHASAQSLLRLLDDVLDFSKIEAGRLELEITGFDLGALVEGVCHTLWPVAAARGVDLEVFVRPGLAVHRIGDPTRLRQVLTNLVSNAIKFSAPADPARGRVRVRVEPDAAVPDGVLIEVADDGIGMDEASLARLFQPFVQAEASTTRRFGGSGLGLAICRRLVELMSGTIAVDSRAGDGSVFRVRVALPCDPERPPLPPPPTLHGVHCRLLEGTGLPLQVLDDWLVDEGAQVRRVTRTDDPPADGAAATVLVCATDTDLPSHLATGIGVLRVGRGRRGAPRRLTPAIVAVDLLRRGPFVQAVAAAAGRLHLDTEVCAPAAPVPDPRVGPPTDAQARAAGQWILVAEDDPTNRKVILRQLALLGFSAQLACDGREALAAWREHRHALVLTDLHMPAMDGWSLARAIRADEAALGLARTPLLALTANAVKGEAVRAREAGIDDCLTKPIPVAQLRAALNQWMPAPRSARDAAAPAAPAPIDPAVLVALVGDDPDTIGGLLQSYAETLAQHGPTLQAGDDVDRGALRHAAHVLKSASRAVGACALADLCERIERCVREDDVVPDAALLAEAAREHRRVAAALAATEEVAC